MDTKPNPILRDEVLKDDVIILNSHRIKHLHTATLHKLVEYYDAVLIALCGTQIEQILEARTAAEEEIKSRKPSQPTPEELILQKALEELNG